MDTRQPRIALGKLNARVSGTERDDLPTIPRRARSGDQRQAVTKASKARETKDLGRGLR